MSGMHYYESAGEFNPETWDTLKNGSRRAVLAGHGSEAAMLVHQAATEYSEKTTLSYDQVEIMILNMMWDETGKEQFAEQAEKMKAYNSKLDQYSQKGHPGMRMLNLSTDSGTIMRAKQVNKSSKGKHPSNYTPPKKKRK